MAEHDAADQEHLRQITQGKLIAQAPEHHEGDDVAGVLCPVQRAGTPLVELLAARATAELPVTLNGALAPFRNGRRAAPDAFRQPSLPRRPYTHNGRNRTAVATADGTTASNRGATADRASQNWRSRPARHPRIGCSIISGTAAARRSATAGARVGPGIKGLRGALPRLSD
jgi:hypothetical protein